MFRDPWSGIGLGLYFFIPISSLCPTKMLTRYERTKSSSQMAINAFINILRLERLEGFVRVSEILPSPNRLLLKVEGIESILV